MPQSVTVMFLYLTAVSVRKIERSKALNAVFKLTRIKTTREGYKYNQFSTLCCTLLTMIKLAYSNIHPNRKL